MPQAWQNCLISIVSIRISFISLQMAKSLLHVTFMLAGYHRLFAHRAYKVQPWFEWVLACMGSGAVEGSIKWWSRDHRAHHRYVDTNKVSFVRKRITPRHVHSPCAVTGPVFIQQGLLARALWVDAVQAGARPHWAR